MALYFPDSPNDGDTHTASNGVTYVYDDARGTWTAQSSGSGGGGAVTSVNTQVGDVVLDAASVGATTEQYVDDAIANIPTSGLRFRGFIDPTTQDPPGDTAVGDMWESLTDGVMKSSWTGVAGATVAQFQMIILTVDNTWVLGATQGSESGFQFRGNIDVTSSTPPPDTKTGDIWENTQAGNARQGWGSLDGKFVEEFQNVIATSDGDWVLGSTPVNDGLPEAPTDGATYGRSLSNWVEAVSEDSVINTKRVRYNNSWEDESVSQVNGQTGDVRITAETLGAATETWVLEQIGNIASDEFKFQGLINPVTTDPDPNAEEGWIYESSVAGVVKNTWPGIAGETVEAYQFILLTESKGWVLGAVADGEIGVEEAPNDNNAYVRQNEKWVDVESVLPEPDQNTGELTGKFVTRVDQPGTFEQIYGKKIFRDLISFDPATASVTNNDSNAEIDFPSNITLFNGGRDGNVQYLVMRDRRSSNTDANGLFIGFEDGSNTSSCRIGIKTKSQVALDVKGAVNGNGFRSRPNNETNQSSHSRYAELETSVFNIYNQDYEVREIGNRDNFLNINMGVKLDPQAGPNRIRVKPGRMTTSAGYYGVTLNNADPANFRKVVTGFIRVNESTDSNFEVRQTPTGEQALNVIKLLTPKAITDERGVHYINLTRDDIESQFAPVSVQTQVTNLFHQCVDEVDGEHVGTGERGYFTQSMFSLLILSIQNLSAKIEALENVYQ